MSRSLVKQTMEAVKQSVTAAAAKDDEVAGSGKRQLGGVKAAEQQRQRQQQLGAEGDTAAGTRMQAALMDMTCSAHLYDLSAMLIRAE